MPRVASPHLKELVFNGLLTSFWRKNALLRFLSACGVAEGFVASMGPDESKRAFLDRMFKELDRLPTAGDAYVGIAGALVEQVAFPDLAGWEDSEKKVQAATSALLALRKFLTSTGFDPATGARKAAAAERAAAALGAQEQSRGSLRVLNERLTELAGRLGTQQAGYDFQDWFYDLMAFHEVVSRRPYVSHGRQMDGTITVEGTTYIVELKFTNGHAGATDIDTLAQKVAKKADNTMGLMVSMSGYSETAKSEASGPGSKLLLLDYSHVMFALGGREFDAIVARARRHASQTGEAYLDAKAFQ